MADMVGKAGSTGALEEIVEETMGPGKKLSVYSPNLGVLSNRIDMSTEAPKMKMLM